MEIIKKRIADMERAEYNPRVELMPGDDEYEKLKRNIDRFGVVVPVIWNKRTNRVVSGHQRLTVLMNEGVTETDVSVVDLDETAEKQLNIAMNKVTGEWDEVKLKELLDGLGGAALETWKRHYGSSVVDFGAGKLSNTRTLRKAGINVSAFEPHFVTMGDKIHKEKSLEIASRFLDEVEAGTPYSSVFISSVFNSVPFMTDRKQIAVIAAALCYRDGMVVCWCQSDKAPQFVNTKKKFLTAEKTLTFDLDYEPNTILGDLGEHPKVQKGHTEAEMREIFTPCFGKITRLELISKFWYLEAENPKVDPAALAAALDFEFELPYPDGTKMGLSARAREAFEHRLGIKLPPPAENKEVAP